MAALRIIFDLPQLDTVIKQIMANVIATSYPDVPEECFIESKHYKTLLEVIGQELVKTYNTGNRETINRYFPVLCQISKILNKQGFGRHYVYQIDIRKNCIVELVIEV